MEETNCQNLEADCIRKMTKLRDNNRNDSVQSGRKQRSQLKWSCHHVENKNKITDSKGKSLAKAEINVEMNTINSCLK